MNVAKSRPQSVALGYTGAPKRASLAVGGGTGPAVSGRKGDVRFPTLADLRWRVDVTISTSALNRVLKPTLLFQLTLSDGSIRTFELTVEQFHELRFDVARVLKDMGDLENNPILKIK